jgi:hypothetical protein
MAHRIAFAFIALCFGSIGSCVGGYHYWDKVTNAELRARENAEAVRAITEIGLRAEAQYKERGTVPTDEELNCWRPPCNGPYFVSDRVRVDESGVIHAVHSKPGVAFTPTSQFKVNWNSRDRTTDRDHLISAWVWRFLFLPWFAISLLIASIPWIGYLVRLRRRRRARAPKRVAVGQ